MPSKNTFSIEKDEIHIMRDNWDRIALTTYRDDYYEELSSATWTKHNSTSSNNAYLSNPKLGSLHRYIMRKWYGNEIMDEMDKRNWIVDHINNNGFDCRITNLEFLVKSFNTAKGQTFDVQTKALINDFAINIFKDVTTNYYQISVVFNMAVSQFDPTISKNRLVNAIYLLYNTRYREVILDAEKIITQYEDDHVFSIKNLSFIDVQTIFAPEITLTEKEKYEITNANRCFIERDGELFLIPSKNIKMLSAYYKKGWKPTQE